MSPRKVTRPLDLYVRVSDVRGRSGDSSISPAEQEKRCRALARPRAAAQDRRSAQSPATSERASGADAWYRKSEGAGIRPAPSTPHRAQRLVVVPVAVAVAVGLRELRLSAISSVTSPSVRPNRSPWSILNCALAALRHAFRCSLY